MTEDQEKNMRAQLAEYGKGEMIDLAISLQDVIDGHIAEKRAMQSSIDAMSAQLPALRAEIDKYEGGSTADPEEVEALNQEVAQLKRRYSDLQALNEGLQRKLIG